MARLYPSIFHITMTITGGRPMRHISFAFTDVVSGRPVHRFVDAFGRTWLAEGRWSRFRVPTTASPTPIERAL